VFDVAESQAASGEDDSDEEGSSDSEGLTGFALLAKRKAKLLKKSVVGIGQEVRSYRDAAKAAQDMLAKLPAAASAAGKQMNNNSKPSKLPHADAAKSEVCTVS